MVENTCGRYEISLGEKVFNVRLEHPYKYESGQFIIEPNLTPPGAEIERKHREDKINYESIDKDIKGLIKGMNELPFLATVACCQGHLFSNDSKDEVFKENQSIFWEGLKRDQGRLWGGWLSFVFEPRLPITKTFFQRLEDETKKFPFVNVKFKNCPSIYEGCGYPSDDCYGLPYCIISFNNIRQGKIIEKQTGIKQVGQYKEFWERLSVLTQEFKQL